ncbi:MAG TPA: hypothetical protein EYP85_12220 [Armatimonadetes bacterium]|nr:hypothetical protein [Armatimonadota bacterium]
MNPILLRLLLGAAVGGGVALLAKLGRADREGKLRRPSFGPRREGERRRELGAPPLRRPRRRRW